MSVQFDPRKLYPIEDDDSMELFELQEFHQLAAEGQYNSEDGDAYYATAEGYIMESSYWNLAQPPDWATHVVFIAK